MSVFTYRYFLHRWPQLCILAVPTEAEGGEGGASNPRRPVGCVVCKIDLEDGDPDVDGGEVSTTRSSDGGNDNDADQRDIIGGEVLNETSPSMDDDALDKRPGKVYAGYIGMLAVEKPHRRSGIGTALVVRAIHRMRTMGCASIRLETEVTNKSAMSLYEDRLGFVREELLKKYYLNWGDAYRLRLWLTPK